MIFQKKKESPLSVVFPGSIVIILADCAPCRKIWDSLKHTGYSWIFRCSYMNTHCGQTLWMAWQKNICSYCSSLSQHWFLSIRVQSHPPNLAFLRDTSGGPFKNVGGDRTNDTFLYLQKGVRGEVWWFPWRFCIVLRRLFARRIMYLFHFLHQWLIDG